MVNHPREKALSELIGFILLLALLILVASLYLTYVVPAHGREGEIAHMDYIKGQFLDYKISTDALWINREYNVPIAQAITLGTQGVKTAGMFAGFQLFTPVFSSGELSVRQNSPAERLTTIVANPLYSSSYVRQSGAGNFAESIMNKTSAPDTNTQINLAINNTPRHLLLNFSTSAITQESTPVKRLYADFPANYGIILKGQSNDYEVQLKAVPRYLTKDFNWTYEWITPDKKDEYWIRYQTDLLLNIKSGGVNILDNYPIYTNIDRLPNRSTAYYVIDLMDPAYGLVQKESQYDYIELQKFNNSPTPVYNNFAVTLTATTGFNNTTITPNTLVTVSPVSESGDLVTDTRYMGRLEFRSHNVYYRVQENFVYQLGGIYVNQSDGYSPLNLPFIAINNQPGKNSLKIDLTDVSLSGDTAIAGSSPVQIQTTLNNVRYSALDTGQENAAFVIIKIENTDRPDIWKLIFNAIKKNAGTSAGPITVASDTSSATMMIQGPVVDNSTRDIILAETFVDFNVALDAVGKTVGI